MDPRRHRSVSRSRREDRHSAVGSSIESAAGTLSPGRRHRGSSHSSHRGRGGEGGFFSNLFSRGKKSAHHELPHSQLPNEVDLQQPASRAASASPAAKLKQMLSFAPHVPQSRHPSPGPGRPPAGPPPSQLPQPRPVSAPQGPHMDAARIAAPSQPMASTRVMAAVAGDEFQARDLQHRMQLLQAQVQDYERVKAQLAQEQRSAAEWREKWNFQNLKLNMTVDMLVLRVLELEGAPAASASPHAPSSSTPVSGVGITTGPVRR